MSRIKELGGDEASSLMSQSVNPMALKKRLAADIVTQFHGSDEARKAEERFASVRQRREVPEESRVQTREWASSYCEIRLATVLVAERYLLRG